MPRKNDEVVQFLDTVSRMLMLKNDDPYRIRAYTDAARAVATMIEDVEEVHEADELQEIPGIGPSIAAKVAEYLDTGHSSYLEQLEREVAPEAPDLLDIPSIGPTRANLIQERLGISTLPALERAAREHRLQMLPGIGERLERRIAEEAASAAQRNGRRRLKAVPDTASRGRRRAS